MTQPPDYLAAAWQPDPADWPPDGLPYVPKAQAERALALQAADAQAALVRQTTDAEKYYRLLIRALFNHKAQKP